MLKVAGFYNYRLELTYNETPILDAFTISHTDLKEYTQQIISGGCGVFMLKYIECLTNKRTIDFTQDHMTLFREEYCIDVFHNERSL